ncbi:hypothetical protein PMAYCL1PPCAC_06687, partial [Pristionchus mayeri]
LSLRHSRVWRDVVMKSGVTREYCITVVLTLDNGRGPSLTHELNKSHDLSIIRLIFAMRLNKLFLLLFIAPLLTALSARNDDGKFEVEACDGEMAVLECPPSFSISNITANYGRMSINSCNAANAEYPTNCLNFEQTKAILEKHCFSRQSCSLSVSARVFGDPCEGISKYLTATFTCAIATTSTTPATTTVVAEDVSIESEGEEKTTTHAPIVRRCPFRRWEGVDWRETEGGRRALSRCPRDAVGNSTWSCLSSGSWAEEGPSLTQCASKEIMEALEELRSAKKLKVNTGLDKTMDRLANAIEEKNGMGKDLSLILDFIHEITPILSPQSTMIGEKKKEEYRKMSLDIVGGIVDSSTAWESGWSKEEKRGLASRYLHSIEKIFLSSKKQKLYSVEGESPLVVGEIGYVTRDREGGGVRIPSMNIGDSAILPPEMFSSHESINILFSSTKNIAKYLPPSTRPFSSDSSRIVSNIVTISHVFDHEVKKVHLLKDKITVVFSHVSPLDGLVNPQCVWWNDESRGGGDWSSSGCSLLSHDEKSTKCQCDHLTHFALLMDVAGMELSPLDYSLLTLLTRVGCGISICCLLLSFLCFLLFTRHGGDRVFIHKNLCLTLALAQTLFVFTISWTENESLCRVISSALLYSFLSALLWMFSEGIQLYFMLVNVFSTPDPRRLKFSLFCYGLPLLIVGVVNYADGGNMISEDHCWLSPRSWVLVVAFVVPSMVIMVSNVFFLSLAIWITLRRTSNGYMPCKHPTDTKPCAWIKGSIALMSLLGVTWSLGFYFVHDSSSVYIAYAFTILNSLQGLFIFLLHVVFNNKMRSDISEWLTRRGCLSTSQSTDSSTRRTANAFSPSNDSTALFIGGECSDSWIGPRGYGGGGPVYPSHEEMMRHHLYHQQMHGAEYPGGGNSTYDYATIAYGDMMPGRGGYVSRPSSHLSYAPPPYLRYGMIPPIDSLPSNGYGGNGGVTRLHQPRLPPPQGMPPLPPLPPSCSPPSLHSTRVSPPSSTIRGVPPHPFRRPPSSEDSAYSDSSSMLQSEVTVDGATVLRMNLGRNTSLIQQDL